MEVDKAIKWVFNIWHEWENVYGVDAEANLVSGNEVEKLEAENKDFRSWNRKLALENEELKNIREQCIAENKARREMWDRIKKLSELNKEYKTDGYTTGLETANDWAKLIKELETKYLGGK